MTTPKDTHAEREDRPMDAQGETVLDLEISVEKARELLAGNDRAILIDVRSNGVACLGHVKGARFVSPDQIEDQSDKLSADRDVPVLVYCSSGHRSVLAAEKLRELGFRNACSLAGGYNAWLDAGCDVVTDGPFLAHQLNRYSRNMLLPEIGEAGQVKLMNSKVLLVGAGGLASSAGLYFAACGIGTLGIVDFDRVDLSNLNRQILHGTEDIGRLKVDSAKASVGRINPGVRVMTFPERLTPENAMGIIADFDVVVDATDNADTKFLLNDACYFSGKPYVFGGAVGFDGQASVFWPKEGGPCLRCLFPEPPPRHLTPT